jgi:SAM-dependent methyltransferase
MTNCRVCNSNGKDLLFKKYGFDIVKCKKCGLVYSDFHPTQEFLRDYYSKSYFVDGNKKLGYDNYDKGEEASRLTARKRIKLLKLKSTGKILDIGCAYGFFLSEMPGGWDKYGLEISKFASAKAININPASHIKNQVLTSNIFSGQKFDLITLWDVLEHLDNPREAMTTTYAKLKKGGKLALSTGDVDSLFSKIQGSAWHLYTPPQHLSYFSPTTIRKLLNEIGFKKISISRLSAYYPISYITHKLLSVYSIKLPRVQVIENITFPLNLGDIMIVTATK